VVLQEGRIVQQGVIRDLVEKPNTPFVERFIRAQRSPLDAYSRQKSE
jgi:osmoprotectant transport system ATP-binding protein